MSNFSGAFLCIAYFFSQMISSIVCQPEILTSTTELSPSCQKHYSEKQFSLFLPKRERPEQFSCRFFINAYAPDVCRLRLNFKQFALADLQPCREQYLRINNKRICGSIYGVQFYAFKDNSTIIEYKSDGSHPLEIEIEQVRCRYLASAKSCDVSTSAASTEIVSPNYPSPYLTPITCVYSVLPFSRDVCQIAIRFLDFDVTDSPDCIKGRLLINGTSYCGKKTGLIIHTKISGAFSFDFAEGSGQSLRGFKLRVDQILCNESNNAKHSSGQIQRFPPIYPLLCCNRLYDNPYFLLTSPGFLKLHSPVDYTCIYQIVKASPQICRLKFTFLHFWLGREDIYYGCTDGFLEIDGRRYCGCKEGLSFVSYFSGERKELLLHMKGQGDKGYIIEVQQEKCFGLSGQKQPEIVTNNPENEVEVFFTNSTAEKVKSRFLVPSDHSRCESWGLPHWSTKIHDILIAIPNHCPVPPPNHPPPPVNPILPPIFPPPPVNPIVPPSNPPPPVNPFPPPSFPPPPVSPIVPPSFPPPPVSPIVPPSFPPPPVNPIAPSPILPGDDHCVGFKPLTPNFIPPFNNLPSVRPTFPSSNPTRCQVFYNWRGSIVSPGYPWGYPGDLKCCYRIRQAPGFCRLQLVVLDFDVAWSPKCWKDYLLLDHRARYCGRSLASTASYIHFRNGFATIEFTTDFAISGRGFRAEFRQIPCYNGLLPRSQESRTTTPPTQVTPFPDFELNVTPV